MFIGTGKTVTGVHIAHWFADMNRHLNENPVLMFDDEDFGSYSEEDGENTAHSKSGPPQVLYCGPSNKSVDVVAGKELFF